MPALTPSSPLPFDSFTLTLPDAITVVEADPAPYANTKEIILVNLSAADRVFVKIVNLGSPPVLPAAATITVANSTWLPPGSSVSLCIGSVGQRAEIWTVAGWTADGPGSQYALVFKPETGVNVQVNVTYVQNQGGFAGS